jgi:hypothetical protein
LLAVRLMSDLWRPSDSLFVGDVEVLEFEFAQSELGGQGLGITCRTCAEEFIGYRFVA